MWFLVPLVPALISGAWTILGLTGGGISVGVAFAADQFNRQRGHRKGEGVFSKRYFDLGISVVEESRTEMGHFLFLLSQKYKLGLEGKTYDLTKSEGASVEKLLGPIKRIRARNAKLLEELKAIIDYVDGLEEQDKGGLIEALQIKQGELEETEEDTKEALVPLVDFLSNIATTRVRTS